MNITQAAKLIRKGELVAFPTETVYGLGADAFNADAVARVYSEKGRPGDNPLILHIANKTQFSEIADNPPPYAYELIEAFWPGPLTLVAKKNPLLPTWVGGHPEKTTATVGIRMPSHPVALEFIKEAGIVAAPSANKSGRPSPTSLAHVLEDFPDIAALDGGDSYVGLESTVVDITGDDPVILRPGTITAEKINEFAISTDRVPQGQPRAPGMKYKHYAPRADMTLVSGNAPDVAAYIFNECKKEPHSRVGVLFRYRIERGTHLTPQNAKILMLGGDDESMARNLFACLREFDKIGVDKIYAETVCEKGIGVAIMDRMRKAAEGRVIHV
ncbi:MAG: L-threonylcarbamoyladenylate synthase [Defluviitaleaceae bacterium]|nr:L-threonylcarbamoyladenylate synthase [Defluviitaleaceae bacterium]